MPRSRKRPLPKTPPEEERSSREQSQDEGFASPCHATGNDSVHRSIGAVVTRTPGACCLQHGTLSWTYDDLWRHSGQIAATLVTRGVRPGDRVAALVDKSAHAVALYLGCLRAGAIYLPLNAAYRDPEVAAIAEDAEPALMITSTSRAPGLRAALDRGVSLVTLEADGTGSLLESSLPEEGVAAADVARTTDQPAAMLYTSGTTGRPKGVVLTHGNLTSNARILVDAWRFTAADVLLHALPLFHVHGLFVALHTALFAGGCARLLDRFDAESVIRHLPDCTVFMGVPTYYTRLLAEADLDREACATLRLFTSGSAPLAPEAHRAFEARTGHTILERYGMTEAGMISSNPHDGERLAGSVGHPLPRVAARVVDAEGEPVEPGGVGVLEIQGPNVFPGYWRRPDADADAFRPDGFLITGDLVRQDPDGRLWIVGRSKDLIISGGLNVYPVEVENALDSLDDIAESAVIGVPHPDFGEGVVAVVVPRAGADPDLGTVRDRLKRILANFKQPKKIVIIDALPRNAMGKVQKNQLRDRYRDVLRP